MMNGAKKSDSSIVPAKLANKAERSAAEPVEGDDGTKRNAELRSTVRTRSREAVTQAQARISGASSMPWPIHGSSVSSSTVSRTSASCVSLQNGSRSALSKMGAEHVAYVALRKAR